MSLFGVRGILLAAQNKEKDGEKWSLSAHLKVAYACTCPSFNGYSPLFCLNQGEPRNTVSGLKCTIYLGIVLNKVCFFSFSILFAVGY